jgi:hypothetical protein
VNLVKLLVVFAESLTTDGTFLWCWVSAFAAFSNTGIILAGSGAVDEAVVMSDEVSADSLVAEIWETCWWCWWCVLTATVGIIVVVIIVVVIIVVVVVIGSFFMSWAGFLVVMNLTTEALNLFRGHWWWWWHLLSVLWLWSWAVTIEAGIMACVIIFSAFVVAWSEAWLGFHESVAFVDVAQIWESTSIITTSGMGAMCLEIGAEITWWWWWLTTATSWGGWVDAFTAVRNAFIVIIMAMFSASNEAVVVTNEVRTDIWLAQVWNALWEWSWWWASLAKSMAPSFDLVLVQWLWGWDGRGGVISASKSS